MSAPARLRTPVPKDPALPRLPVLLDPEAMAPFLQRSLGPETPISDVRIHHLRYQPGRKLVVRYDIGLDGLRCDAVAMTAGRRHYLARRAEEPESIALARLVAGRSPAMRPLSYEPDLDALVHWYPLDLELPALAEPPARLLEDAGVSLRGASGETAVLAYKPRRRAVLRVGEHVLKVFSTREEFAASTVGLEAAAALGGVRTAAPEGALASRLVTVQSLLAGAAPADPAAVAREVGALLRELQDAASRAEPMDLFAARPRYQLSVAVSTATYVAALLPELGERLAALLRRLEARVPAIDRLVFSHGDFSARQLLVTPDGLALVDFDARRLAPAALDPTTYAAHVVVGGASDVDDACEVLDELVEGYGSRPPGLSWYLAASILRHSRYPFRCFDERWPDRVEGMIAAAENALDRKD